jgi:hypothetical protein
MRILDKRRQQNSTIATKDRFFAVLRPVLFLLFLSCRDSHFFEVEVEKLFSAVLENMRFSCYSLSLQLAFQIGQFKYCFRVLIAKVEFYLNLLSFEF